MTYKRFICSFITGLLLIAGCASVPDVIPELEQARAQVAAADRDPMAGQVAGDELSQAKDALARAEQAKANRHDLDEIKHYAYLAGRHADIVSERVAEAGAREEIERSEAERNRVLLEARAVEARRAEALAEASAREAQQQTRVAERQRERAEDAIDQARSLEEEARQLEASLQELQAEQTERGLVLTLGDVLFDTNEAEIKSGSMKSIDRLAEFLRENEDRRVLIEGYTDTSGADTYNLSLSQRRADAVQAALIRNGISPDRIRSAGLGEAYPVATNDTAAGRQQNRRVEIVISDKEGDFPLDAERTASRL
jgi:outer membrane protein OmpA-like peptidoglycan-associated protein